MSSMLDRFYERSAHLNGLPNSNPAEAVKQAHEINLDTDERFNLTNLRAVKRQVCARLLADTA